MIRPKYGIYISFSFSKISITLVLSKNLVFCKKASVFSLNSLNYDNYNIISKTSVFSYNNYENYSKLSLNYKHV